MSIFLSPSVQARLRWADGQEARKRVFEPTENYNVILSFPVN